MGVPRACRSVDTSCLQGMLLLGAASAMCLAGYSRCASMGGSLRRGNLLVVAGLLPLLLSMLIYLSFLPGVPAALLWAVLLVMLPVGLTMPAVMWAGLRKFRAENIRLRDVQAQTEHEKYAQDRLTTLEALGPDAHLYQLDTAHPCQ